MDLFNEIGKKITRTTQEAVKSTKDLAEAARLNGLIADEEKLLGSFYLQIGKKFYELSPEIQDENFRILFESVSEALAKIKSYQEEIQRIKGIKKCLNCGAEIPREAAFCGNCGQEAVREAILERPKRLCPNCSRDLPEDVAFCTECGHKL